jgi:hypothetical protein
MFYGPLIQTKEGFSMLKHICFVGVLFLSVSCQNAEVCPSENNPVCEVTPPSQEPQTPIEVGEDVPDEAGRFGANITFTNFDASDEAKVQKAIVIIKKVIATSEFRNRVLNFSYKGKLGFVDNGGLTNAQIYQKLLDGAEDLKPVVDHTMDLDLELYYSVRSTVGYTYPDVIRIWMNTKFFDSYTPVEVADNVFHEWTHKLGFDHAASYSESRDYSVPYGLGYLMEELGAKIK